ncbi:hypothetical protein BC941DRAFT_412231 [Chlamydoabsidia padenii]|nr:hypothetical protein BC941DRAFT_412231 [Chlamydoabsidia padenii]
MQWKKVIMTSTSNTDLTCPPLPLQQTHLTTTSPTRQPWSGNLPMPPTQFAYSTPLGYSNSLNIINRHDSLLTLLDTIYPDTSTKNTNNKERRHTFLCLYPHCDRIFRSMGSLRFHISKAHIVDNKRITIHDQLHSPITISLAQKRDLEQQHLPKRRGRPPKNASAIPNSSVLDTMTPRGRPPKTNQWIAPFDQSNHDTWTGQLMTFKPHRPTEHS